MKPAPGKDLLIRQAPLITAMITPDVSLDVFTFPEKTEFKRTCRCTSGFNFYPEVSAPVVNVCLSDVRVVHEGQDQLALLRSAHHDYSCRS